MIVGVSYLTWKDHQACDKVIGRLIINRQTRSISALLNGSSFTELMDLMDKIY